MSIRSFIKTHDTKSFREWTEGNPYVGRGVLEGLSPDGRHAVLAYFIMGRSDNSRNRIFVEEGENLKIEPFDASKVEDPSLIIYYPIRRKGNALIVTNGDQTDTIYDAAPEDGDVFGSDAFVNALRTRDFEPDKPNWTPRISGIMKLDPKDFQYRLSILKSADPDGTATNRYFYEYQGIAGVGHLIHTYNTDGNPIPTFTGDPHRVIIPADIDEFTDEIWTSLNPSNKISLYVRCIDLETGEAVSRLVNKNA